jgi:hypothetical protein
MTQESPVLVRSHPFVETDAAEARLAQRHERMLLDAAAPVPGLGVAHHRAYGHVVAATEIVCGLAFTAILTGLTFVRFSRPRAKLVFGSHLVVAVHNGKPTLVLRIGNGRADVLLDAAAKLNVLQLVTAAEGDLFRRAQELRLERAHLPVFPSPGRSYMSWTNGARCTATMRRKRSRRAPRCS